MGYASDGFSMEEGLDIIVKGRGSAFPQVSTSSDWDMNYHHMYVYQ